MSTAGTIALILAGAGIAALIAAYWWDRTHPTSTPRARRDQQTADDLTVIRQVNTELRAIRDELAAETGRQEGK